MSFRGRDEICEAGAEIGSKLCRIYDRTGQSGSFLFLLLLSFTCIEPSRRSPVA
jgi:hypothetical protein